MIDGAGYLGLDLGGTGVKAGVFDRLGNLLGFAHRSCTAVVSPQGFAEVPIEEIEQSANESCIEAVRSAGVNIRAVSIASQGQTFVTLDEHGKPLHPAILWYDSRAGDQASCLQKSLEPRVPASRMPQIESISVAPKVMWLRENSPSLMSKAHRYLLLPDYLSFVLTGLAVTDVSTASSTGLYAEDAADYCSEALGEAGIPRNTLADIFQPGLPIARIRPEIAKQWGLQTDTLLVSGTNDQYSGALGAGNYRPGILTETTGTCLALVTLAEKLPGNLPAGLFGGRFAISRYQFALAYIKTAGLVLDWFRREFCNEISFDELDEMAAKLSPASHGITLLPDFDGMVSPRPNPNARGAITGLNLGHGRVHIYRAILESLAFGLRENLELLKSAGFRIDVIRLIGGGAKSDLWCQIKADVLGMQVERPAVAEAAVLGAAMLASVGAGDWTAIEDVVEGMYQPGQTFVPNPDVSGNYDKAYRAYLDLSKGMYGS